MENQYQLLDAVIKSRMLAFDDEGYEELLEMDVDSFRKRYRDASEDKLKPITKAFSDAFEAMDAFGLKYMINSYIEASDAFNSADFDWGRNKQMTSRRKFCLWMFRQAYLNNPELHDCVFTPRKEDWKLYRLFKPEDDTDMEAIDIAFTMLLSFQVIRPFGSENMRALKYSSPSDVRKRMIDLLETLDEDIPVYGATKTLHSIRQALDKLNDPEMEDNVFPPAVLWGMLNNVACELQLTSSPAEFLNFQVKPNGYAMAGIWVDDGPDREKRFWVFPNNKIMAFCYRFRNREWILEPFEFVFTKQDDEFEFDDVCSIITSKGNMEILLNGKIEDEELARLTYELDDPDEEGMFQTIRFEPEIGNEYPYWMNWRSFRRLPKDDSLMLEYTKIIEEIYRGSEMLRDFNFRNIGPWITNLQNSLVGLDLDFLYLVDFASEEKGYLDMINENDGYPHYNYYVKLANEHQGLSLFGVEISEKQPMYVVPRDPMFYEILDKKLNSKALVNIMNDKADRDAFLLRYEDFKETVLNTEFNDPVTIYKNLPHDSPDVICFNKISRTFILDEVLEWFGVRKFNSRDQLLNSDLLQWRNQK